MLSRLYDNLYPELFGEFLLPSSSWSKVKKPFQGQWKVTPDESYRLSVQCPGYGAEDIKVTLEKDHVTVTGKTETETFSARYYLPWDGDNQTLKAVVDKGILTLTMSPKKKEESSVDIPVTTR